MAMVFFQNVRFFDETKKQKGKFLFDTLQRIAHAHTGGPEKRCY